MPEISDLQRLNLSFNFVFRVVYFHKSYFLRNDSVSSWIVLTNLTYPKSGIMGLGGIDILQNHKNEDLSVLWKVQVKSDWSNMKQHIFAELLGFPKFNIYSKNRPKDPIRPQMGDFPISLIEPLPCRASYRAPIERA